MFIGYIYFLLGELPVQFAGANCIYELTSKCENADGL